MTQHPEDLNNLNDTCEEVDLDNLYWPWDTPEFKAVEILDTKANELLSELISFHQLEVAAIGVLQSATRYLVTGKPINPQNSMVALYLQEKEKRNDPRTNCRNWR